MTDSLVTEIAYILYSDEDIEKWCQENYKPLTIFGVVDTNNLPHHDDSPLVSIVSMSHEDGRGLDQITARVAVFLAIYDEAEAIQKSIVKDDASFDMFVYEQTEKITELKDLIGNALSENMIGQYSSSSIKVEFDPLDSFPWFCCSLDINLTSYASTREYWGKTPI